MTTFLEILTEIKELIKGNISVFDEGFAYCRMDSERGLVVTAGNEAKYVGINDVEGDYFYIRGNGKIGSTVAKSNTDCAVAVAQKMPLTLVAVVKDAEEFKLLDALINELLRTKVIEVRSCDIDPVQIMSEEFKGLDKEAIQAAQARIGERTIVKVDFEIVRNFQTNSCEYNICKTC